MLANCFDCPGAERGNPDFSGCGIICIGAKFALKPDLQHGFLFCRDIGVWLVKRSISQVIQDVLRFAVKPVGRPVGRHI